MLGNLLFSSCRAVGKEFSYAVGKLLDVLMVQFRPTDLFALTSSRPYLTVSQTFSFRLLQCLLFYQQSLPFIAFTYHPTRAARVGAPGGECGITRRKKG